jgi:lipoprotein-releasing system permease protein
VTEVYKDTKPGQKIDPGAGLRGIVLGQYLAEGLGVSVGDEVVLTSPLGGSATIFGIIPHVKKFAVVGIFTSGMYDYDSSLGTCPWRPPRSSWAGGGASRG